MRRVGYVKSLVYDALGLALKTLGMMCVYGFRWVFGRTLVCDFIRSQTPGPMDSPTLRLLKKRDLSIFRIYTQNITDSRSRGKPHYPSETLGGVLEGVHSTIPPWNVQLEIKIRSTQIWNENNTSVDEKRGFVENPVYFAGPVQLRNYVKHASKLYGIWACFHAKVPNRSKNALERRITIYIMRDTIVRNNPVNC